MRADAGRIVRIDGRRRTRRAEWARRDGAPYEHDRFQDDLHHGRHRAGRQPRGGRSTPQGPSRARLVRASSDTRWLDAWGVEKVDGDLADPEALRRGVAGADWVFNCAAKVGDWGTLEEFRRLNVEAFGHLLAAAADARVARFVHVSSLGVYEARDHFGTDETIPPAAESLDAYTRSKVEAEELALRYVAKRGLPLVIVRPGFIYGPRDRTVLPKLLHSLRTGRFAYFGSGNQALNCIYVKNLVHGIFLAAEVPEAIGEVFNLTDGGRVSKRDFIGRVAALAGLRTPRRKIPALARLDAGHPAGTAGEAAPLDRAAAGQQGALQVPRPEPGLLDRQGRAGPRLPAPVHDRARTRRVAGRAVAPDLPHPTRARTRTLTGLS